MERVLDINVAVAPRVSAIVLAVRENALRANRLRETAVPPNGLRQDEQGTGTLVGTGFQLPAPVVAEVEEFLADVAHRGKAGTVHTFARPSREPGHIVLVGVGDGNAEGWRQAGAAVARAVAERLVSVAVALPTQDPDLAAAAFAEGAWLGAYKFRLAAEPTTSRKLRRITLIADGEGERGVTEAVVARARALTDAVILARDLTNTPSAQKSPRWFADRVSNAAARHQGVNVTVHDETALAAAGFGGVLAVGGGSVRPPRLVEVSWRPRGARVHVVLVGKGICFDSGGISIKPLDGMKLMRKDMGGAAAVCAAVLGAADLNIPVRLTALAPMAENMVSGSSMRPGDVIRHFGGATTEILDTDAEGRLVLADALAYGARRLKPDYLVDLATLTGASHVALGKRTAALFSHDDELASGLRAAGEATGEPVWQLPIPDDYLGLLRSDVADLANIAHSGGAGSLVAALFLREFTEDLRQRWAHIDMSAPSWSDRDDGPLVKGATGWGVRILIRWLQTLSP